MIIEPSVGVTLVELASSNFGAVSTVEKKFDSITSGTVIAVHPDDKEKYGYLVGKIEHHREYKDDARVKGPNGEKYAFIEIKDILGTHTED
jgi:hypothetical protein